MELPYTLGILEDMDWLCGMDFQIRDLRLAIPCFTSIKPNRLGSRLLRHL